MYAAFLAGWKAKNKTAETRKKRGFVRPAGETRTDSSSEVMPPLDLRKASSRCKDCRSQERWSGDLECPMVQSGEVPNFEKKPVKKAHVVNWLGVVQKVEPPSELVRIVRSKCFKDADNDCSTRWAG